MTTTEQDTQTQVSETVATYLAAWNEPDARKRAPMIAESWAEDGRLIDPPFAAQGHAQIVEAMSGVHAQYPGHRFRQASPVDVHHDQFRYAWELLDPSGDVVLAGIDVGEVDQRNRLTRVAGFWGDLQTGE